MTFKFEFNEEKRTAEILENLMPQANYPFIVADNKWYINDNGNKVCRLDLNFNYKERTIRLTTFLTFKNTTFCERLIRHFCASTNIKDFETNEYRENYKNLRGYASIGIKQDKKEDGTFYPPKNFIEDFVKVDIELQDTKMPSSIIDDELPF